METSSGIGYERDAALRGGSRQNARSFNLGVEQEKALWPVDFSGAVRHGDLVPGDLVSLRDGKIVPLDPSLEFVGIIEKVGEDRGKYIASVITRCAILGKIQGLTHETRQGAKVYALPGQRAFTLEELGVLVGEFLAMESVEYGTVIVGIKLPDDTRKFELGGPRPSRAGQ